MLPQQLNCQNLWQNQSQCCICLFLCLLPRQDGDIPCLMTSEASCGSRAATHLEMSLQPPPLSKFKSACIKTDRCIMSCCGATAKGSNTVSSCQEAMSLVIKQVVLWGPEDSDQMLPCICRNARWALVSLPYRATVRCWDQTEPAKQNITFTFLAYRGQKKIAQFVNHT